MAVDGRSLVCVINFTTTQSGLTGQLLSRALHLEKPELEQRKSDLLLHEEELKIQVSNLEDALLDHQLSTSSGNILENKELLELTPFFEQLSKAENIYTVLKSVQPTGIGQTLTWPPPSAPTPRRTRTAPLCSLCPPSRPDCGTGGRWLCAGFPSCTAAAPP